MKEMKRMVLLLCCIYLVACASGRIQQDPVPRGGMYKVTILYPNGEDRTFDMDYYQEKHMPMVAGFLGPNLNFYEIDQGISGRTPNDALPFLAIGYFYINDINAYNEAIAANRDAIISDFKNYTNVMPVIQISEIKKVVAPSNN